MTYYWREVNKIIEAVCDFSEKTDACHSIVFTPITVIVLLPDFLCFEVFPIGS